LQVHSLKGKLNLEPNPSKRPAGGVALFPQPQKAATLEVCVRACVCMRACVHVCVCVCTERIMLSSVKWDLVLFTFFSLALKMCL